MRSSGCRFHLSKFFQDEEVQSALRGMWCATAEGKTSCISWVSQKSFLLISSHSYCTFNRAALLTELAVPPHTVLTHTKNMLLHCAVSQTCTHILQSYQLYRFKTRSANIWSSIYCLISPMHLLSLFIAFCESYTSTQGSEQWQCVHSPYDLQPTHYLLQVLAAACGLALPTGPALSSGTEPGKDQHKGFMFVSGENSFFAPKCQILQKPKPSRVISIFIHIQLLNTLWLLFLQHLHVSCWKYCIS